ncbi:MAG TPA: DNA-3-methyladenine glycosylase I, partial [Trueperaceae bacterium]|nr:DNA-3-methyladenine glycosylase I [Trueperaceae bacterium]
MRQRCSWVTSDQIYIDYHDLEWGVAIYDEQKLFELLSLESFQAGLSWITVLKKRDNFRKAFDNFDYQKVANYDQAKVAELLENKGIIRNRLKINATINNANAFMAIQKEYLSFSNYAWSFVDGKTKVNHWQSPSQVPATSKESELFAKDLKKHGFKFLGPTTVYAFMQSAGMVMDH